MTRAGNAPSKNEPLWFFCKVAVIFYALYEVVVLHVLLKRLLLR